MEVAKVTSKGQITIPISIRRKLEINEGDKVLFMYKPDGVMMVNPNTFQGGVDVVEESESEIAAEAIAAEKKRAKAKATPKVTEDVIVDEVIVEADDEAIAAADAVLDEAVASSSASDAAASSASDSASAPVSAPARSRYIPPAIDEPKKPEKLVGGVDLSTLLDDLRDIGTI